jgi:5-methylcytosine-specific restriction endonuclease McrA
MSRYLNRKTRDAVAKRARFRCEYCLLHEDDAYLSFEIDHIISLKHGGNNELNNLEAISIISFGLQTDLLAPDFVTKSVTPACRKALRPAGT